MRYYIRYNVDHKNGKSEFPWKVFISETEFFLTRSVIFRKPTWTHPTILPDGSIKYSLHCDGTMTACHEDEIVIE
jgi:hypothetical protein